MTRTPDVCLWAAAVAGTAGLPGLLVWPRFAWLFAIMAGLLVVAIVAILGEAISRYRQRTSPPPGRETAGHSPRGRG